MSFCASDAATYLPSRGGARDPPKLKERLVWNSSLRLNCREMKSRMLCLALLVVVTKSFGQTPPPAASPSPKEPPPPVADYDLRWGVKIPMRDKVELNATLYLPRTPEGFVMKAPVIFTLTPYISDSYHARAAYFAARGYAFALVDVRGRGNSAGEFEPFAQEPRDGHDVVEWLSHQPYCNGKVTMWGGSYAGFDQWATAREFPEHLATIVPVASAHPPLDYRRSTTSAKPTMCSGSPSPAAAPARAIFLGTRNSGAPNISTPTRSTSPSKRSIPSSAIRRTTFSAS
jgi:hypothetical protein